MTFDGTLDFSTEEIKLMEEAIRNTAAATKTPAARLARILYRLGFHRTAQNVIMRSIVRKGSR